MNSRQCGFSFPAGTSAARALIIVSAAFICTSTAYAIGESLLVGPNVNINRQTGYQAETAIAIDPTNPQRMFAWSNDLNSRNSAAFTTDGGASWTSRFTGTDGWPALGGDPTCTFDPLGNLYGASFNSSFGSILVRSSTNGGQTFPLSVGTFSGSFDQPTIDAGPGVVVGQASAWITYESSGAMVARGATATGLGMIGAFGAALSIPSSAGGNFGDIAVGPNGRVAVAYQNPSGGVGPSTIFVATNISGSTAGPFTSAGATVPTNVGGFRLIPAQPSRSADAEVGLGYDITGGAHNGRLYMTYTDAPSAASNDLNVFTRFSDNNGTSWTSPLRVNTDVGTNSQFFSKLAVDPVSGAVAVVWYDCRNSPTNNRVELWGTVSLDGGASFLPEVKISVGSTSGVGMGGGNELGDYLGLDFYNGVFYPVWADNSNSTGNNPNGTTNLDYYGARVSVVPEPASLVLLCMAAAALGTRAGRQVDRLAG